MKERSTKIRYLIKGLNESKGFFFFFFCSVSREVEREGGIVGRNGTWKTRGRHRKQTRR
jgi:hypothetical protein